MRLHLLSDLHLDYFSMPRPESNADVVVLAGDIARPDLAIEWALGFSQPVLYVPGNHEFYGSSFNETLAHLKQLTQGTHIQLLNNDSFEMSGVRFLGSTLWTDFNAAGKELKTKAMAESQLAMRDFSRITMPDGSLFTPQAAAEQFAHNKNWLIDQLNRPYSGPTVVITHHAPSFKSIHPHFAGSLLNVNFVSDLEALMDSNKLTLWLHGHMHDSSDYQVNGVRVVANPRGYAKDEQPENPSFSTQYYLDI